MMYKVTYATNGKHIIQIQNENNINTHNKTSNLKSALKW